MAQKERVPYSSSHSSLLPNTWCSTYAPRLARGHCQKRRELVEAARPPLRRRPEDGSDEVRITYRFDPPDAADERVCLWVLYQTSGCGCFTKPQGVRVDDRRHVRARWLLVRPVRRHLPLWRLRVLTDLLSDASYTATFRRVRR